MLTKRTTCLQYNIFLVLETRFQCNIDFGLSSVPYKTHVKSRIACAAVCYYKKGMSRFDFNDVEDGNVNEVNDFNDVNDVDDDDDNCSCSNDDNFVSLNGHLGCTIQG